MITARKYRRRWIAIELLQPVSTRLSDGTESISHVPINTHGVRRDLVGTVGEQVDTQTPLRRTQYMVRRDSIVEVLLQDWTNWKLQQGNTEFNILGVRENPFNPQVFLDIEVEFQGRSSLGRGTSLIHEGDHFIDYNGSILAWG